MEENIKYEEALAQLETIVRKMEANEYDIDELAAQLKTAQRLIAFCKVLVWLQRASCWSQQHFCNVLVSAASPDCTALINCKVDIPCALAIWFKVF